MIGQTAKIAICEAKGVGGSSSPSTSSSGKVADRGAPGEAKIGTSPRARRQAISAKERCATSPIMAIRAMSSIEVEDGLDLSVNVQNDSRLGGAGVERGQKVWVHWSPEDSIVLTE